MYLFINNLNQDKIFLAIFKRPASREVVYLTLARKQDRSESILKGLNQLFKKTNQSVKDIKGLIVVNGPGSFTGIRVALSIANTMAWQLKIPVVGISLNKGNNTQTLIKAGRPKLLKIKTGRFVRPFYGRKLNITKPKAPC
ncbi:tRNA (adenosine(37)-N6)-threonylcarbamoyltransferase complex dimerization subunit type 1 TsaB [Patescibacteria group bacterium]|nr:tRNA (adenosine(37)-N6)-threonylcarbamoyltransferase complex dimerization subunit type 1 TsaB [Patescibacteria group bacterium]